MALGEPDERAFRKTMSRFPAGVAIVTALAGGRPRGVTASAFAGVSARPPLVLVWVNESQSLDRDEPFAVSVLADHQLHLAQRFAQRRPRGPGNPFDTVSWWPARVSGIPVLSGTVAWFDCVVQEVMHSAGHTAAIGHVLDLGHIDGEPLLQVNGGYRGLDRPVPPPLFPGATRDAGHSGDTGRDSRLSLVRHG